MRYRKPKSQKGKKDQPNVGAMVTTSEASVSVPTIRISLSTDEGRILGYIRRDLVVSSMLALLVIAGLVWIGTSVAYQGRWDSLAETVGKGAGLIK